jgi:hypothetical protein
MSSDGFMTDSGVIAVRFASVKRTEPHPLAASWPELVAALSDHVERAEKLAGALWSPVAYCDGARRSLAGVDQVFAFVADLDGHDLAEVMPQHAPGEVFAFVVGGGEPIEVPAVSAAPPPVRRAAGKRVEPRRSRPEWLDESWWNEPQDLSRFEGKTKREKLEMLYAEFQDLRRILQLTDDET